MSRFSFPKFNSSFPFSNQITLSAAFVFSSFSFLFDPVREDGRYGTNGDGMDMTNASFNKLGVGGKCTGILSPYHANGDGTAA
jgi:hypothetical protein